ncbi:hypothetical protein ACGFS9_31440 [Streptomyces sp. NPDC048566]|uniref:hypothetical protein n=1 Tax=Streptomyces sp. NPDC048566 TaxID=3365569 RepID=UPI003715C8AD
MNEIATPARRAVAAGLAVFMAGFGTLFVFHLTMDRDPRLPGMFTDLCETWGDALALPVMTGALVFAVTALPSAVREARQVAAVATAGGATGALTQLVRWVDEDHELTWAHPEPHHFNAAGVYHAVFLTLMCAATASLWTVALKRAARAPRGHRGRPGALCALVIAMVAGLVFVALLVIDDWEFFTTTSGAVVLATTMAAAALSAGLFTTVLVRMCNASSRSGRRNVARVAAVPLPRATASSVGGTEADLAVHGWSSGRSSMRKRRGEGGLQGRHAAPPRAVRGARSP